MRKERTYDKLVADRQRLMDNADDICKRVIPECEREGAYEEIELWRKDLEIITKLIRENNKRLNKEYDRLKRKNGYIHCYFYGVDVISEHIFFSDFSWTKFFRECKFLAEYSQTCGVIYVVSPNGKKTKIRKVGRLAQ